MGAYSQEEMYTATQMVRNFSAIVSEVSEGKRKRAIIVKNNRFEAVLLNMQEYERMQEAVEILERIYAKTKRA
ncbi:type II toxin-antitoxin system prevent-host-death family antitoxin [Sulfurospirillum sp. T05]|uniref:Antitoxin n=1 Tax=Sulfurospirillum tamanense TaxID=2813362 RepID=A0ABS2WR21_9BACT|nr:type II toxin-antitoxin system prevent-host-death family antitoxin [Sulfurospirillum tamanensis]MBN2964124.1 type II toxin-antitoxin system prevent-host-death family antitoxin [Sulfurospirillum tamanensis]